MGALVALLYSLQLYSLQLYLLQLYSLQTEPFRPSISLRPKAVANLSA